MVTYRGKPEVAVAIDRERAADLGVPVGQVAMTLRTFFAGDKATDLTSEGDRVDVRVRLDAPYRERPEGLLALTPVRDNDLAKFPVQPDGLYLVAEAVEKPGNLGSLLRSADASGVAGLLLCDKRTDLYNPNTLTASTGAIFHVPIAECPSEQALAWLRAHGVATLAATPHTDKAYYDVDLTGPVAVVVGAEQYGLSDFWMDNADLKVAIPMLGKIDSLNVAIATSVLQ